MGFPHNPWDEHLLGSDPREVVGEREAGQDGGTQVRARMKSYRGHPAWSRRGSAGKVMLRGPQPHGKRKTPWVSTSLRLCLACMLANKWTPLQPSQSQSPCHPPLPPLCDSVIQNNLQLLWTLCVLSCGLPLPTLFPSWNTTVLFGKFLVILAVLAQMLPLCLWRLSQAILGASSCVTSRLVPSIPGVIILL